MSISACGVNAGSRNTPSDDIGSDQDSEIIATGGAESQLFNPAGDATQIVADIIDRDNKNRGLINFANTDGSFPVFNILPGSTADSIEISVIDTSKRKAHYLISPSKKKGSTRMLLALIW